MTAMPEGAHQFCVSYGIAEQAAEKLSYRATVNLSG